MKAYVVVWVTSDYDQINTQCEGIYRDKETALKKVQEILDNINVELTETWSNDYDNGRHYIIEDWDNDRWDDVILYEQEIK